MRSVAAIVAVTAVFAGTLVGGLSYTGALDPDMLYGPKEDNPGAATAGWKTHSLPKEGFAIQLPAGWVRATRNPATSGEVAQLRAANRRLSGYLGPLLTPGNPAIRFRAFDAGPEVRRAVRRDGFVTNMNILRADVAATWEEDLRGVRGLPNRVGRLDDDEVSLPAGKALRLRYEIRLNRAGATPVILSGTQYSVFAGSKKYVLSFSTTQRQAATYTRLFEHAAESFRVLGSAA